MSYNGKNEFTRKFKDTQFNSVLEILSKYNIKYEVTKFGNKKFIKIKSSTDITDALLSVFENENRHFEDNRDKFQEQETTDDRLQKENTELKKFFKRVFGCSYEEVVVKNKSLNNWVKDLQEKDRIGKKRYDIARREIARYQNNEFNFNNQIRDLLEQFKYNMLCRKMWKCLKSIYNGGKR